MFNAYNKCVEEVYLEDDNGKAKENKRNVFVQSLNPMLGKMEWKAQPEDYDYQQEIARAAFADMLHDSERNLLYYQGLKAAIEKKRKMGEKIHVLDIGTGTGLLSMMAAKLGADKVTALEEFAPMFNCARRVIEANGLANRINLIGKRSTEVKMANQGEVTDDYDMHERANVLVTEVFDTELIGEAAIATFNHAHQYLLTDDCIVVPCEGVVYAQVVSSDLAAKWNSLHPIALNVGDVPKQLTPPVPHSPDLQSYSLSLHDLQLSQFKEDWFKPITSPVPIFKFDFNCIDGKKIPTREQTIRKLHVLNSGKCDAVFMWWNISMDPDKNIVLSCAPKWAQPSSKDVAWRDHWMQAIYYPINNINVEESADKELAIISNHDEYCFWFDVRKISNTSIGQIAMPMSTSGIHMCVSRTRLGQINDSKRNVKYVKCLKKQFTNYVTEEQHLPSNILCISELTLLPLIAAAILSEIKRVRSDETTTRIFVGENSLHMKNILKQYQRTNKNLFHNVEVVYLDSSVMELNRNDIPRKVEMVIGEPNFSASLLPWHNLLFWFTLQYIMNPMGASRNGDHKSEGINDAGKWIFPKIVMPKKAQLWAVPVFYHDLWKIRAPLHDVHGFKMEYFDQLIMNACDISDADVEPHPLWEYPCVALSLPKKLMDFDLTMPVPLEKVTQSTTILLQENLSTPFRLNGMALWMEWYLDEDTVISGGPSESVKIGHNIVWDVHSKQGVSFFPHISNCSLFAERTVHSEVVFDPNEGDLKFKFVKMK